MKKLRQWLTRDTRAVRAVDRELRHVRVVPALRPWPYDYEVDGE